MTTQQEINELSAYLAIIYSKLLGAYKKPSSDYQTLIEYQTNKILQLEQENEKLRANFRNLRKTYGGVLAQLKDEIRDLTAKFSAFYLNLEDSQAYMRVGQASYRNAEHENDQLVIKSLLQSISELQEEKYRNPAQADDFQSRSGRIYYGLSDENYRLAKSIYNKLDQKRYRRADDQDSSQAQLLHKLVKVEKYLSQIDYRVEGLYKSLVDSLSG